MAKHESNSTAMLLVVLLLSGCGYPEISPKSYELSKALYSACNRQSDEHLTKVVELIDATSASGEISEREAKWLTAIIDQARAGEWDAAMTEARKLMEDQATR